MVVRHESAGSQVVFHELTEVGAGGHGLAQHLSGRDVGEVIVVLKARRLGPLAGTRCAEQNQMQESSPIVKSRISICNQYPKVSQVHVCTVHSDHRRPAPSGWICDRWRRRFSRRAGPFAMLAVAEGADSLAHQWRDDCEPHFPHPDRGAPAGGPGLGQLIERLVDIEPLSYVAYRALSRIEVDGRLDEPSWQRVPWTGEFIDIEGADEAPAPPLRTRAKMIWDDDYFYVAADIEEPQLWASVTERDDFIYHDNDFEVFIDPDGDTHEYYEYEINAFGTSWDLFLVKPYRDGGPFMSAWDIKGMKKAVQVWGTVNDPRDEDEGWTVELAFRGRFSRSAPTGRLPPGTATSGASI